MRVFRKRRKFGNFGGAPDEAPLPDIVYQMGAESAARFVASRSSSPAPYAGMDPYGQEGIYGYPVNVEDNYDEGSASSPLRAVASVFGLGRSKSRERRSRHRSTDRFVGNGSPVHFAEQPLGSPVKFRRRPGSPGMMQPRAGSPYHFAGQERVSSPIHFVPHEGAASPPRHLAHSRPSSPDVIRRLQRAQLSQDLQHLERQQRRQQEFMMVNPIQYAPQYQPVQQPYYPMANGYSPAYQPQIFSYY